jgi:membrane protein DedA with SNARE-associated domain
VPLPALALALPALPLASVTGSITSAIGDHAVYTVFLLMMVDAVFPAASELVMLYAGAVAAGAFADSHVVLFGSQVEGRGWALVTVIAAGTLGYTIGAVIGWAIGIYGGRPFLERRGRWFHLGPDRLERADRWFDRWDDAAVLVGRLTPIARSFVSIPAGVFEMPLGRYVVLTFIGSTIWCAGLAGGGFLLGSNWDSLDHDFRFVEIGVVVAIAAGIAWLVLKRRTRLSGGATGRQPE